MPVKRFALEIGAGSGVALVDLSVPPDPWTLLVLGHGAGGDSHAAVLVGVRDALVSVGAAVALVDQPYRVAGRRAPDRAERLDEAMLTVVAALLWRVGGVPLVLGGKSNGARVGVRIARTAGAAAVVVLGFPLVPPGRQDRSRAGELDAGCPVLVVQGSRDTFGTPAAVRAAAGGLQVHVHTIAGGDHSFVARRSDGRTTADCLAEVAGTVTGWVQTMVLPRRPG